jgi:hypothetical protein
VTREELATSLAAIEQAFDQKVELWRIVYDEKGNEVDRIYRGSFIAPPGSHVRGPQTQGVTP